MISTQTKITISASVTEGERAAVQSASSHIARALSQAAEAAWTCEPVFISDRVEPGTADSSGVMVTSLLPYVESNESWPETEKKLRAHYATLSESGVPVFICTVLRHVGSDVAPETAESRRVRIRRLNLLAADISRESGAFVIDLDRALADIGARRFQTDYRLGGNSAAEMAGHYIAQTVVSDTLDAFVSPEVQEATSAILASNRPAVDEQAGGKIETVLRKDVLSLGHGKRKQMVQPVHITVEENYAGWLVGQILSGSIGPAEAWRRLVMAVRKRGVFNSTALLFSGLSKQLQRKK